MPSGCRAGADPNTHTKLGRGGLADVEWTVQLLQLRFAGLPVRQLPGLRSTGTLAALLAAVEAGKLSPDDAAALEAAWRFASRARDAIMLVRDKPDDQLPKPGRVLQAVGQVLGYRPDFQAGQLIDDYRRAARRARKVVESVFYDGRCRLTRQTGAVAASERWKALRPEIRYCTPAPARNTTSPATASMMKWLAVPTMTSSVQTG